MVKFKAVVNSAIVVEGFGQDLVSVQFDLPDPTMNGDEPLTMDFKARKGIGVDYVRLYFGIEPQIVHRR